MMKRCPDCNGSIVRLGHKEKPFFCNSCNKWFSNEEVTPKQTKADRIRSMSDEELARFIVRFEELCYRHAGALLADDIEELVKDRLEWLREEYKK